MSLFCFTLYFMNRNENRDRFYTVTAPQCISVRGMVKVTHMGQLHWLSESFSTMVYLHPALCSRETRRTISISS